MEDPFKYARRFDDLTQRVAGIEGQIPPRLPAGMPAMVLRTFSLAGDGNRTPVGEGCRPEATVRVGDGYKIISGGAIVLYTNDWNKSIGDLAGGSF